MLIKILHVAHLKNFELQITFSEGTIKNIDFAGFILNSKKPDVQKYQKPSKFKAFSFKNGELRWGDFEMIFPIMDLYKGSV